MRTLALALPALGLVGGGMTVGLTGAAQLSIALLILLAVGFGLSVGIQARRVWGEAGGVADVVEQEGMAGLGRRLKGPVGALLLLAAATAFAAIQAHALGEGIRTGAPAGSFALLLPPVVIAGLAIRAAARGTG